jgi:asparagine synthase (glutamine-hydrolysing)
LSEKGSHLFRRHLRHAEKDGPPGSGHPWGLPGPPTHQAFRVDQLDQLQNDLTRETQVALGHSRLQHRGAGKDHPALFFLRRQAGLIHNGEIYNYQQLSTLLYREHEIKTSSDSEVIVHLLEETYRGDLLEAVQKVVGLLDGMYALAVSDGKSVVVARDPVGKKPLYYIQNGPVTYFASEKKALWNGIDEPVRLYPGELLHIDRFGLPGGAGLSFGAAPDRYRGFPPGGGDYTRRC